LPRKDETKVPEKLVNKAVKRHLEGGESAIALAREYRVSRATLYNWVAAYRRQLLARAAKQGMSAHDAEASDKRTLVAKIRQLELENARLRDKVVSLMIKGGEI
jgi:transposase-like protein